MQWPLECLNKNMLKSFSWDEIQINSHSKVRNQDLQNNSLKGIHSLEIIVAFLIYSKAFWGHVRTAIVLLVCLVGISLFLYTVREVRWVQKSGIIVQPENPKGKRKAKHSGRQKEMNTSDGQPSSSTNTQVTANDVQDLVKPKPPELANSADKDGDISKEDNNDGLQMNTGLNPYAGFACSEDSNSTEQRNHLMTKIFSEPITLKSKKKTQGKHKSSDRSKRHPGSLLQLSRSRTAMLTTCMWCMRNGWVCGGSCPDLPFLLSFLVWIAVFRLRNLVPLREE